MAQDVVFPVQRARLPQDEFFVPSENIAFAVLERAGLQPDAPAFIAPGRVINYERAAAMIVNFARRMQEHGVTKDSRVALSMQGMPTATIAALAMALIGCRWAWTAVSLHDATHTFFAGKAPLSPTAVVIDSTWYDAPPLHSAALPFADDTDPEQVWMTGGSSGTTGARKFMQISYGTVWKRILVPELQDGVAPVSRNLFPVLTAHGVRVNVGNLVAGGANASISNWDELRALGVNRVTGSPMQVSSLLFRRAPPERRIRSVKVAGAHVTRQFVETALRYAEEVHLAYGATEVGAVARSTITHVDQLDGSIGQPNDGAQYEIVDPVGVPLPAGTEGIIRVRTGWMVDGYIREPELTAATFRDGWFHPGDMGYLDANGLLHITGRTNDVLNLGGAKFNAANQDELIQLHPRVADGYCFVSTGADGAAVLCAIVQLKPGAEASSITTLNGFVRFKLGRDRNTHLAYVVDAVPRNENGKPMRREAASLAMKLRPLDLPAA